ncbi:MAG TPA: nicotinamide mononucleotide transporter family protein [Micromonosporaceae bacterium]|jgi:nicotinamide mononucleotide transporter
MHWLNHLLTDFYTAQWHVTSTQAIYYREIVGNGFGLASALFGLRRMFWAWPVGIAGNVLLFTVFLGQALGNGQGTPLYGQASRQVFFVVTSIYGWWRWQRNRRDTGGTGPAVMPRWATTRERALFIPAALVAVAICFVIFRAIGAGFPVPWWYYLADSWIFVGSMLATYAMARGWVDFWLFWIAVDLVGVPELLHFHYYPSAILYAVYAGFVIWGFFVWRRISREEPSVTVADPAMETVG